MPLFISYNILVMNWCTLYNIHVSVFMSIIQDEMWKSVTQHSWSETCLCLGHLLVCICTEFCIMREKGGRHWYYLYLLCIDDWEQSAIFLLYFNRDMCCKIKVLIYMLSWVAVWVVIIKWLSQNIQILDHDLG